MASKKDQFIKDNLLSEITEMLNKQSATSGVDLEKVMEAFENNDATEVSGADEMSMDLVMQAHDATTKGKAKKLIKEALGLNPNNAEAYLFLSEIEPDLDKAIIIFKKAIEAAKNTLGRDNFTEFRGNFWLIAETRPYMKAKLGLADCYHASNEYEKSIDIYKELILLNTSDNLGVRYMLSTLLLETNMLKDFKILSENFKDDVSAVMSFNMALFMFKKEGTSLEAKRLLLKAHNSNKYVLDFMIGKKELPQEEPVYTGFGDENEAIVYVSNNWMVWKNTENALDWLFEFSDNRSKLS